MQPFSRGFCHGSRLTILPWSPWTRETRTNLPSPRRTYITWGRERSCTEVVGSAGRQAQHVRGAAERSRHPTGGHNPTPTRHTGYGVPLHGRGAADGFLIFGSHFSARGRHRKETTYFREGPIGPQHTDGAQPEGGRPVRTRTSHGDPVCGCHPPEHPRHMGGTDGSPSRGRERSEF